MTTKDMSVEDIEDRIQCELTSRRVKLHKYFQDKDPTTSGFITWNHFETCLSRMLDIILTPLELRAVKDKYDTRKNETFNYRLFCKIIEGVDTWFDSRGPPVRSNLSVPHPMTTHSPLLEDSVKVLLIRLATYLRAHTINLYGLFVEVDKLQQGLIPFSQFLRTVQTPAEFSENDVKLLMQKYQAPEKPGYFDYVTFFNDLEWVAEPDVTRFRDSQRFRSRETFLDLPPSKVINISIKQIIDKVMRGVYKYNIHLYDFLNVYDIPRAGVITPSQFEKGVWLAVGNETDLTSSEIHQLAQFFRNKNGQIPYREFCNVIDSAFLPAYIQTTDTGRGCRMDLGHPRDRLLNVLSEEEEKIYESLATRIANEVDRRQLQLLPAFEDFENRAKYPELVTAVDFSRVLNLFDIDVTAAELQLLCRKFEDPVSGGIYFKSFMQEVDKGYQRFRVYRNIDPRKFDYRSISAKPKFECYSNKIYDVYESLRKIRHHVLNKRLRVSEFFKDYDITSTGVIPQGQFIRGLDLMLVGSLNHECRLTPEEINGLVLHYRDPAKPDCILWRRFELDVDAVFETRNLEKSPSIKPEPAEYFNPSQMKDPLPLWTTLNQCSIIIEKLRPLVRQRNINMLTYFRDFDKSVSGHVNLNQFDRTMKQYNLELPSSEWDIIKSVYCDNKGFNYRRFLSDLQPVTEDEDRYPALYAMLKARLAALQTGHPGAYVDLLDLLCRLRTQMRRRRLLLIEYLRDHDKSHRNLISKASFRRSLNLATFNLTDSEYELLEKCFESPDAPDHVDYLLFYDMVNSVFTLNNLEKSPLTTPFLFKTEPEIAINNLGPEDDKLLWTALHRMGRRVRQEQRDMIRYFLELDPTHSGFVSRQQFHRVLEKMNLGSVFTDEEFDAISRRFKTVRSGRHDVNYRAFCNVIEHLAQNDQTNEFWQ